MLERVAALEEPGSLTPTSEAQPQPRIADADLWFYDCQQKSRELAGQALERLADFYQTAASEKSSHIALLWPGTIESTPLVHALSCFAQWADGNKRGIRGLYYPAKQNSFHALNHIFLSRTGLSHLANKIQELLPNPHIRVSCKDKDAFLFAVNSLKEAVPEEDLRPSLNELIPHFSVLDTGEVFKDYSSKFYARLRSKLTRRTHSKALAATTFTGLGTPERAPDALFALGYKLTRREVYKALHALKTVGGPDVLLLDGTRRATRGIPDWRSRFVILIKLVKEMFGEGAPGILVVTDDPRQLGLIKSLLKSAPEPSLQNLYLQKHGIAYTRVDSGLVVDINEPAVVVPEGKVSLLLTDGEIGGLIDDLVAISRRLEDQEADSEVVRNALKFLNKLAHLPGSLEGLWEYLDSRDVPTHVRESFDWRHYRGLLRNFATNADAKDEQANIERCVRIADKLVGAYTQATPLGLKVKSEIERVIAHGRKPTVVVRRPLQRAVLFSYLSKNGISVTERLIVLADELSVLKFDGANETLIFADMTPDMLRRLVTDSTVPSEVVLALTAPMAKELKFTILPILHLPEFKPFHPKLQAMLDKLEEQLLHHGGLLLEDNGISIAAFTLKSHESHDDSDVDDADAVLIDLEDGQTLKKGKHSVMYVYDPAEAEDGYSGFRPVEAEKLEAGQQVFLMSSDLRELMEGILGEHGVKVGADAVFETGLRTYHDRIAASVKRKFDGTTAALVRWLKDQMLLVNPKIEGEISNVRHWIDLGHSPNTPFDQLAPQAPRSLEAFKAFCRVLGITDAETAYFWDFVIKPLRGTRRKTGRWLSDVYTRILFDPDSAIAYAGIERETLDMLRRKATEQLFTVNEVLSME